MALQANILPSDTLYCNTSEDKCSRCGCRFHEDEVPLHLWVGEEGSCMYSYCEKCTGEVLG